MTHDMAVAAPMLFVACKKIAMNGKPVGLAKTVSASPRQKIRAISAPNAVAPLINMLAVIAQGTFLEAFWTSSATRKIT
jgi:hypothetical protein